jgi:NAD(P)-dependent dehydrogenase (short-subunit alcohol dehydrogenase family)
MTTEQGIVFGFIAAAFLFGWLARAGTEWATRSRRRAEAADKLAERVESAADESRRELERAIRAYHATVSDKGTLESLAQALYALALAVGHASGEVEHDLPLAGRLRQTGEELRNLAQDVMTYSSAPQIPTGVLDQLEQLLGSAVSTLLVPATEGRPA